MPRDWQNLFAITRFCYIEVLFHNLYFTITGVNKIILYTKDFVTWSFHCSTYSNSKKAMVNYSLKSYLQISVNNLVKIINLKFYFLFFMKRIKTISWLGNAFWNKWVLRAFLKALTKGIFLLKRVRLFHNLGAELEVLKDLPVGRTHSTHIKGSITQRGKILALWNVKKFAIIW